MTSLSVALVGRYVHFTRTSEEGLELQHQGRIIAADERLALIHFDMLADGGPPMQGLVTPAELHTRGAFLYQTAEQMHAGYERFAALGGPF